MTEDKTEYQCPDNIKVELRYEQPQPLFGGIVTIDLDKIIKEYHIDDIEAFGTNRLGEIILQEIALLIMKREGINQPIDK